MQAQMQIERASYRVASIRDAATRYEDEQHAEQLRKARKAIIRAQRLIFEAERFLSQ